VFCVVVRGCYSVLDGCYSAMWLLCGARLLWVVVKVLLCGYYVVLGCTG